MTAPFRALTRAAFVVTLLASSTSLLRAQTIVDGPAFSADPKVLLAEAQKVDAKEFNVVYLLDEATFSFETDGRTKAVWHQIERVVTADGVNDLGTVSAWWAS